ncbi:MAG: hypothetical protein IJZ86_04215 [Bacteroides sp.]|nr:hypothetical protein [Bacteroides sp.]
MKHTSYKIITTIVLLLWTSFLCFARDWKSQLLTAQHYITYSYTKVSLPKVCKSNSNQQSIDLTDVMIDWENAYDATSSFIEETRIPLKSEKILDADIFITKDGKTEQLSTQVFSYISVRYSNLHKQLKASVLTYLPDITYLTENKDVFKRITNPQRYAFSGIAITSGLNGKIQVVAILKDGLLIEKLYPKTDKETRDIVFRGRKDGITAKIKLHVTSEEENNQEQTPY